MSNNDRGCNIVPNDAIRTIVYLLSLNDTVLTQFMYIFPNSSLDETRFKLRQKLIIESPATELITCRIHRALWWFIPPILLLIGSVGNILACVVLCRHLLGTSSSYLYLTIMVILDEITLMTGLLRRYFTYITHFYLENISNFTCSLTQFSGVACSLLSVWLIVALTIERVLVIYMPLKAKQITQNRNGKIVIFILLIVVSLISSHFFVTVELMANKSTRFSDVSENKSEQTTFECTYKQKYSQLLPIWTIMDASLYSIIPFCILLCLNVLICHEMLKTKRNRSHMMRYYSNRNTTLNSSISNTNESKSITNNHATQATRKASSDTYHLSVTLIAISLIFLLTTTPLVTFKLAAFFQGHHLEKDNVYKHASLQLMDTCFELLMYINHSINFLLYCVSGNRFRKTVVKTLRCGTDNNRAHTFGQGRNRQYTQSLLCSAQHQRDHQNRQVVVESSNCENIDLLPSFENDKTKLEESTV